MDLGERIKEARQRARLSQEKVAELIGVSRQAVTKWEAGQSAPTTDNLFKLAEVLGTTVDLLIAQEDSPGSIAQQIYRMIKEDQLHREAERKARIRKNVLTCLAVLAAFLLAFLSGKLLCWKKGEMPLITWLIIPVSREHTYLFGWLLSQSLFQLTALLASGAALLGWRRLSVTTLVGFLLGLPIGEFLGALPDFVGPGYHYGWAIWGGIYLISWGMGIWLQKMDKAELHLASRKLQLWLLIFAALLVAIPCLVLSGVPGYASP